MKQERMSQRQFFEYVEREMAERFPEYDISIRELPKNNSVSHGLMVRNPELEYCPSLKLDKYWMDYEKSENPEDTMSMMLEEMGNVVERSYLDAEQVGIAKKTRDAIVNWRKYVQCSLVMKDGNEAFLSDKPHIPYLDMEKVYSIRLDDLVEGTSSKITITNDQLNSMGCSLEELDQIAMDNTLRRDPPSIRSIASVLAEIVNMPEELFQTDCEELRVPMYVVTTESKYDGAAVILYKDVLDQICDALKTDKYYVLPSSRHEVICVPEESGRDVEALRAMVHEVNANEVPPEDLLSESVYQYIRGQSLEICGMEQEELPDEEPVLTM